MPAAPPPNFTCLTWLRVDASITSKQVSEAPAPRAEIKTLVPSVVNFRRFAPRSGIGIVCRAFLVATSMMVTVASRALAAQLSLPSGEMSKPSTPWPAGTFVTSQVRRGPPEGGPELAGGYYPGAPPEDPTAARP